MIKIEHTDIVGFEAATRGMRNPMNSWEKSDSHWDIERDEDDCIGKNDLELMKNLAAAGTSHSKYRRMIVVYADITAPLYWWKEFDTYKVGTVANSCSTMHMLCNKEFTLDDFSHEHLIEDTKLALSALISLMNNCRETYLRTKDKTYWWQIIQLLPASYNQRRTVMLNYEVLAAIYRGRAGHKLDEWEGFRKWITCLPCSVIICGGDEA